MNAQERLPSIPRCPRLLRRMLLFSTIIVMTCSIGCATRRNFSVVEPIPTPAALSADSIVRIEPVRFSGAVQPVGEDVDGSMVIGITEGSTALRGVQVSQYEDATLLVDIESSRRVSPASYPMMVPVLGFYLFGMMGGSGNIKFNWTSDIDFVLRDRDGVTLQEETFQLEGEDSDSGAGIEKLVAGIAGGSYVSRGYPNPEEQLEIGRDIARIAGTEIARRIQAGPASDYFAALTRERDGMNAETHAAYLVEKAALEEQARAYAGADLELVRVAQSDDRYRVAGSSVVVLGVGIDRYRSDSIPNLHYAANDCQRVVGWFKANYELTENRATCLVDENATALTVDRHIRNVAAQHLGENDTFVFYFRGHGGVDVSPRSPDSDGLDKYLLFSDSELDAMPMTSLQLSSLFETIDRLPARRKIILIDGSFGGEVSKRSMASLKGISVSQNTYSNVLTVSGEGTVILAAGAEHQETAEVDALESGLFSHFLVKGLAGEADDNRDTRVDILELHQYVNAEVRAGSNGAQTPVFRGSLQQNIEF